LLDLSLAVDNLFLEFLLDGFCAHKRVGEYHRYSIQNKQTAPSFHVHFLRPFQALHELLGEPLPEVFDNFLQVLKRDLVIALKSLTES
jgi:hypothetical protein